jgi:hypothetical protein
MPPPWAITPDTLSLAARRLYEQWSQWEVDGDAEGWPWAVMAAACAAPVDDLYDLLAGGPTPWAPAFDPELAAEVLRPEFLEALLPWVGQFVGVSHRAGLPPAGQRIRLLELSAKQVGSPGAIIAAARQRAVGPDGTPGSATVLLVERIGGDPYHFAVTMYEGEVPDPEATRRDIEAETPAGRFGAEPGTLFDFNLVTGGNVGTVEASFATLGEVEDAFATLAEIETNPAGLPGG